MLIIHKILTEVNTIKYFIFCVIIRDMSEKINNPNNNQEDILRDMQNKHMRKILTTPGLKDRVVESIKEHSPRWELKGDSRMVVSRTKVGITEGHGEIKNMENLQIGIEINYGDGFASTAIATVAHKVEESGEIEVCPGFTEDDAVLVNECIDELELAKISGQIPNISLDLSRIVKKG